MKSRDKTEIEPRQDFDPQSDESASPAPNFKFGDPLANSLAEVVGQSEVVRRLDALIELYRRRSEVLSHLLFVGSDGCGKRTMAHIVARELGVNLRPVSSGSDIERASDLLMIINDLDQGDVLFIESVNRLRAAVSSALASALKDFELPIIFGKGSHARSMRLRVGPFTLIGSVEKLSDCASDLVNTIPGIFSFQRYSQSEILEITERLATRSGFPIEPAAIELVARLADGSPARSESMLRRLSLVETRPVTENAARELLSLFGHGIGPRKTLAEDGIPAELGELSGVEFERLIADFLNTMGFVAEMTKASGDGGIDIEAFLDRPIVGGRYLIQCKRFSPDALVGSPIVREFYGALVADRKAVKGILVTTSGFTPQAQEFAANLPIELIDGAMLSELLNTVRSNEA